MIKVPMYPLRFEPIYQYRLWGGRRLADLLAAPLPGDGPIGEAWLLSDRDDHPSKVAAGPLKGSTIRQLLEQSPEQLLGKLAGRFRRFPVLLKFLDAREKLSVQVHPEDGQTDYIPTGESGKTEAWVVLEAGRQPHLRGPEARQHCRRSEAGAREPDGRGLAGELHAEGRRRRLHPRGNGSFPQRRRGVRSAGKQRRHVSPVRLGSRRPQDRQASTSASRAGNGLHRFQASRDRSGGAGGGGGSAGTARATLSLRTFLGVAAQRTSRRSRSARRACRGCWFVIDGEGELEHGGANYPVGRGDVVLLPAEVGACSYRPRGAVSLLEVALPE